MSDVRLRAQIATLHWTLGSGHITDWSVAVDGGAHEGHWTKAMAQCFSMVFAFEPWHLNFGRASKNLFGCMNVTLRCAALLDRERLVRMSDASSKHSAACYVVPDDDAGYINAVPIDSLGLQRCGLIKLDVEGAEFDALIGARHTIKRFRPVLIVEIKGLEERFGHPKGAVRQLLHKMGYRQVHAARPDFVLVPE